MTDDVPRAAPALFGDLEPGAAAAAHGRLVLQGLPSFLAGSTGTPHAHPTTYVH